MEGKWSGGKGEHSREREAGEYEGGESERIQSLYIQEYQSSLLPTEGKKA